MASGKGRKAAWVSGITAAAIGLSLAAPAGGYVGESYIRIPEIKGQRAPKPYDGWIRAEAHYWKKDEAGYFAKFRGGGFRREKKFYSTPGAPQGGPEGLVLSIDKNNPVLPRLMAACAEKTLLPEMTFAESAKLGRGLRELGPRPAAIPEYFEYRLKDARIASCPLVANAPEQAILIEFGGIDWINYSGDREGVPVGLKPAVLPRLELT